jgi:AcrR family transcriptional regulator
MQQSKPGRAAALRAPRQVSDRGVDKRGRTRLKICAAANELFVAAGFGAVTMEQIAGVAGIRRSTLYTHFADKESILAAIAKDYVEEVCTVIRLLPGPVPDAATITAWLEAFVTFVEARPGPAELMMALGRHADVPQLGRDFGAAMLSCYAERLMAFEMALHDGEGFRLAWAHATLSELGGALTFRARQGNSPATRDRLAVAAMLFGRFVREER